MKKNKTSLVLTEEHLFSKIFLIRGQKVMLDSDLADLYMVETKVLKRAVRRNIDRFPGDFMFELTAGEIEHLRCQTGASSWGGTRYTPFAFTEQGVAMLSSVLSSKRAIEVNISIMRIFVKMRQLIAGYKELLEKVEKMEASQLESNQHIENIYGIIKELLGPTLQERKPIGYRAGE